MTFEDQIRRIREAHGWTEWQIVKSAELSLWLTVIERAWEKVHTPIVDDVANGNAEAAICEALHRLGDHWGVDEKISRDVPILPCAHCWCANKAEWMIIDGFAPEDYTYACTEHIGSLLQSGRKSTVVPLERESS